MSTHLTDALINELHHRADAARWQVTPARFREALVASVDRAMKAPSPSESEVATYCASLRLADLALACACADGHEAAWEQVVGEHRPGLLRAAEAMAPGRGHELADSLFAELFGLETRKGERRSLFRYFHGRSQLGTWLRAVLAQRVVDQARSGRRLRALPDDESPGALSSPSPADDPERARHVGAMRHALGAALRVLPARDRLRLACYYAKQLRMAEIGRVTGESEATVSRQLARTRRAVRSSIEQHLRDHSRLDEAGVTECFRSVADDPGVLDLRKMLNDAPSRKEPASDRSTTEEVT